MKKHRVLIVEDDTHLLSGIKAILELGEYSVITAHNGVEGLRVLGDQGDQLPDVIVSDITMPYMDGFRFLEEVRKQDSWVRIPFIFLTAHSEPRNKHKGALAGADVYLTKPFNAQDLLLQVSARIDRIVGIADADSRIVDSRINDMKEKILATLWTGFSPSQAISTYAEMFKEIGAASIPQAQLIPLLKNVNSGANRVRRLVENFITLVELDSGDAERTYEWRRRTVSNLGDHVMDAYQQITYPDDEIRDFQCYIPEDLPEFTADVQMMTMAIRELLDNAAKFTPSERPFIFRAAAVDDWIEIQVQDFGSGISQNRLETVWHAFYQSDRGDRDMGSGLAIVHGIVQLHGGSHSIISDKRTGTTVTIRLPQQPPASIPRISRNGGNLMNPKYRVLVVEDDAHLLSGIKEILELEQYIVMTAHNGVEGLRVLHDKSDQPPDIIVSDIAMPYMDGYRFLEEVRKQDNWVKIPFIFLTAHGEQPDRRRGVQLGADDYLTKPFNAEDLIVSVKAKIDRGIKIEAAGIRDATNQVVDVKRKILTILNHEFRTPLTLVVAYAELLKEFDPESMDEDDVMTFLKGVNSGANRLRRLVENFITLVELDSTDAEQTYLMRRRPIANLYDHVMDAFQQITYPDDQPRPFECYIAEDIPEFVADAQMMTTAIRELLDNAAKFTPVDKHFTLRAQCVGDWVEIQVEDFGRGLPEAQFEPIWQAFYQYERDKFEHQGAGSGLAIVDGILRIHGGVRSVISEEGTGSVFTIRLPVQPPITLPRIGE